MDNILIEGHFGTYKGITYRTVSYWNDVELFCYDDIDHEYVIRRVPKNEMEDLYTLHLLERIIRLGEITPEWWIK